MSDATADDFVETLRASLEVVKPTESGMVLTVEQWGRRINGHLGDAVENIVTAGRDLIAAKDQLGPGRWGRLFDENNPERVHLSQRSADYFMAIARHPVLGNPHRGANLPLSWRTLGELARLPEEAAERAIEAGEIHPELERPEAIKLVHRYNPPKPTPARKVKPGDRVQDSHGDEREVTEVEEVDGQVVIHSEGEEGDDAIVLEEDEEVRVISKPDLGNGVSHPARFSDVLIPVFAELLEGSTTVLDPFAGTGRIHLLQEHGFETVGIEIEPEWAEMHPDTHVGNALILDFPDGHFDAICTSPTYGNRLADHHDASDPETRRSYTHDLGRKLTEGNSGELQWGSEYRAFHEDAWAEAVRVLRPGGRFVLNIKDHIRGGKWQDVAGWHLGCLVALGLTPTSVRPVVTPAMRAGSNAEARVGAELVIVLEKDE